MTTAAVTTMSTAVVTAAMVSAARMRCVHMGAVMVMVMIGRIAPMDVSAVMVMNVV